MFEIWREATATSVPALLCQSGRRRPENVSILSSLLTEQKLSTNTAAGNQQTHLEFTFSIKAFPFHSRASIRAHKHIF